MIIFIAISTQSLYKQHILDPHSHTWHSISSIYQFFICIHDHIWHYPGLTLPSRSLLTVSLRWLSRRSIWANRISVSYNNETCALSCERSCFGIIAIVLLSWLFSYRRIVSRNSWASRSIFRTLTLFSWSCLCSKEFSSWRQDTELILEGGEIGGMG